jgi:hypothetical protein
LEEDWHFENDVVGMILSGRMEADYFGDYYANEWDEGEDGEEEEQNQRVSSFLRSGDLNWMRK